MESTPIFYDLSEEEQKERLSNLYNAPGLRYTHAYCNLHRTNKTPKDNSLAQVQQGQRLVHELRRGNLFNELDLPQLDPVTIQLDTLFGELDPTQLDPAP